MVEQGKRARGWHQRYLGARVNCEGVPRLPAGAVAWVLEDPRHVPYLMVWKDQRSEEVIEAVRVCAYSRPDSLEWTGWVDIGATQIENEGEGSVFLKLHQQEAKEKALS